MKTNELKKRMKVWCWWKSRFLYYTGIVINGDYKFVDINGAITMIIEKDLEHLEKVQ